MSKLIRCQLLRYLVSPLILILTLMIMSRTSVVLLTFTYYLCLISEICLIFQQLQKLQFPSLVLALNYCNSLLTGLFNYNLHRLQRVQDRAARIVCRANGRSSAAPLLRRLHWLPVASRVDYKVALMTFKLLSSQQPSYLSACLIPHSSSRFLRSSSHNLLTVPFAKSSLFISFFCCLRT